MKRLKNDTNNIELTRVHKKEMREKRLRAKREGNDEASTLKEDSVPLVNWKKLSGDVGRIPRYSPVLCFFIGTGVQVGLTIYTFLITMCIGHIHDYLRVFWI